MKKGLNFDDVLLFPRFSDISSRTEPIVKSKIVEGIEIECPIIPANMDCIASPAMHDLMFKINNNKTGNFIYHRFIEMKALKPGDFVTIGLRGFPSDEWNVRTLAINNHDCHFVIDIAHAHSKQVFDALAFLKKKYTKKIIVGNVGTKEAARDFCMAGVDGLKIGIGSGHPCLTRNVTGCGVPQITAIKWVSKIAHQFGVTTIADGGIGSSDDAAKALAAGADSIMIGSMLAGTDEAAGRWVNKYGNPLVYYKHISPSQPDEHIEINDHPEYLEEYIKQYGTKGVYREYWGQSSADYQKVWFGGIKPGIVPEGETLSIPYSGPAEDTIYKLAAGLKSSMSYVGARDLDEFRRKAEFIKVNKIK
jgi:IMP dehydrogenase